mmetsp:Transcript_21711/g.51622  ORF Transcript_21711/g.51622 Transcript_21711/m.51622 type:complete len:225 (+) Transcript_21711:1680-2354(+)
MSGLLYTAARCASAAARPTAFEMPMPKGPVVTSMPSVSKFSGWPGVLEPHWRNCFRSSRLTLSKPARCSSEYWSMHPCPEDSTKRSRFAHLESSGLYCISSAKSKYPMGAWPMGAPGWPLLALFTASTARKRMALMHSVSTSTSVAVPWRTTLGAVARFGRTAPAAPATATAAPSTAPELLEAVEAEAAPRVAEEGATALVTGDTKLGASMVAAAPAAAAATAR